MLAPSRTKASPAFKGKGHGFPHIQLPHSLKSSPIQLSLTHNMGHRTTAMQAVQGRDLSGLQVILTGGNSGIGGFQCLVSPSTLLVAVSTREQLQHASMQESYTTPSCTFADTLTHSLLFCVYIKP